MSINTAFLSESNVTHYFRFLNLLSENQNRLLTTKLITRLRLVNKRYLLRIYKKLLKFKLLINFESQLIVLYCLIKKYSIISLPWILEFFFNIRYIAFFAYHFLILYQAIFLLKMILDWFPIKNWDRASPLKRFLRRVTIDWTKQFEKYFPSFFAWIIVINIIPILLAVIESFYVANDLACFPISYKIDDLLEFIIESKSLTIN